MYIFMLSWYITVRDSWENFWAQLKNKSGGCTYPLSRIATADTAIVKTYIQRYFKLFVPCIFSTYGMKTNWCHYFIRILLDLYMFWAHRPIFRRVRTAAHTTIGSVSVPLCSRAHRAREQSGTETEPMVVWTAVRTLLKMGLWARNM